MVDFGRLGLLFGNNSQLFATNNVIVAAAAAAAAAAVAVAAAAAARWNYSYSINCTTN